MLHGLTHQAQKCMRAPCPARLAPISAVENAASQRRLGHMHGLFLKTLHRSMHATVKCTNVHAHMTPCMQDAVWFTVREASGGKQHVLMVTNDRKKAKKYGLQVCPDTCTAFPPHSNFFRASHSSPSHSHYSFPLTFVLSTLTFSVPVTLSLLTLTLTSLSLHHRS